LASYKSFWAGYATGSYAVDAKPVKKKLFIALSRCLTGHIGRCFWSMAHTSCVYSNKRWFKFTWAKCW